MTKFNLKLQDVPPSGSGLGLACSDEGSQIVSMPHYPASTKGDSLRAARRVVKLSLGDCARLLGLSAVQMSGLETGRYTLSDVEWAQVFRELSEPWPICSNCGQWQHNDTPAGPDCFHDCRQRGFVK